MKLPRRQRTSLVRAAAAIDGVASSSWASGLVR